MAAALFELRKIRKSFDSQAPVVDQLSLELQRGEIFGLLGESGAGKSTLLQLAANLLEPDAGEVWLEGEKLPPPSDLLIPGHRDIKIVHQDYQLAHNLSVRENIRYALRYYEKTYRDSRIEALLELCHLQELAERKTHLLSGGEKQRTAIACALAEEASVLLLDEPFANLDLPNHQRLSASIRNGVAESGAACIFVTHYAVDALSLSQRMGILQSGRIVQVGTPEEIYHRPLNAYVATLSGTANILEKSWVAEKLGPDLGHQLEDGRVMIRPEQFLIQAKPGPDSSAIVVVEAIFEGSRYRFKVDWAGQELIVYGVEKLELGQNAFLSMPR